MTRSNWRSLHRRAAAAPALGPGSERGAIAGSRPLWHVPSLNDPGTAAAMPLAMQRSHCANQCREALHRPCPQRGGDNGIYGEDGRDTLITADSSDLIRAGPGDDLDVQAGRATTAYSAAPAAIGRNGSLDPTPASRATAAGCCSSPFRLAPLDSAGAIPTCREEARRIFALLFSASSRRAASAALPGTGSWLVV